MMADIQPEKSAFLKKLTEIIKANLVKEQFGVSELARVMGMSRSNLHRKVITASGMSVSQFIRQVRLKKALELLQQNSLTISEVAFECGFHSVSYFNRCFHDYYGYPPGKIGQSTEGEVASYDADHHDTKPGVGRKRRTVLILGSILFVITGLSVLLVIFGHFTFRNRPPEKSIAVLPFINDSPEETEMYFINWTMEEILNSLSRIEDLRIVSRTSVEQYRNNPEFISKIAKEMNVSYILEGSGLKQGDTIRLTVQLIAAKNDRQIWTTSYKRKKEEAFDLSRDIARQVAAVVESTVTSEKKLHIEKTHSPSQEEWIKHPDPVMLPGSAVEWDKEFVGLGSVIYHDTIYHMWYTGGSFTDIWRIGHATSPDGITWTKDTNNPVLDKGPVGSWDESIAHAPNVLVINDTFHMWYTGHRGSVMSFDFQIGHATSPDGITWTKDPNNPVLPRGTPSKWDHAWISVGSVLFDGFRYHMWYMGFNGIDKICIGHATSTDGLTWTKDTLNPVLISGNSTSWDFPRVDIPSVLFDGDTFRMWYAGGGYFTWKIGYATSIDGSKWTKYHYNPVLTPGQTGSWDSGSVFSMSVIDSLGVKYKMWYCGSNAVNTACIGYAEKFPVRK